MSRMFSGTHSRLESIHVRLTPGEYTKLLAEARPLGLSIVELLRRRAFGDAVGLERGDAAGGIARLA